MTRREPYLLHVHATVLAGLLLTALPYPWAGFGYLTLGFAWAEVTP